MKIKFLAVLALLLLGAWYVPKSKGIQMYQGMCFIPETESIVPCPMPESGSVPTVPNIGVCQEQGSRFRCVPAYPHRRDEFYEEYRDCKTTLPYSSKKCLLEWAEKKDFDICGPTVPGTDVNFAGDGEIEVPYQASANNTVDRITQYQCAGVIPPQNWSPLMEALGYIR